MTEQGVNLATQLTFHSFEPSQGSRPLQADLLKAARNLNPDLSVPPLEEYRQGVEAMTDAFLQVHHLEHVPISNNPFTKSGSRQELIALHKILSYPEVLTAEEEVILYTRIAAMSIVIDHDFLIRPAGRERNPKGRWLSYFREFVLLNPMEARHLVYKQIFAKLNEYWRDPGFRNTTLKYELTRDTDKVGNCAIDCNTVQRSYDHLVRRWESKIGVNFHLSDLTTDK